MEERQRLERLDEEMLAALSRTPAPDPGERAIFQLSTTGPDDRPHVALLGDAEVHAPDSGTVRVLVWGSSSTAGNLRTRPRALVSYFEPDALVAVDVVVKSTKPVDLNDVRLLLVSAEVVGARRDRVPYARISTGPTFVLLDESVHERWGLAVDLLRSGGA
jgi:hypothetical protein